MAVRYDDPMTKSSPASSEWAARSRRIRASARASAAAIALAAFLVAIGGCAGSPPVSVPPGTSDPLAPDEGFLVVQIDTALLLESVTASGVTLANSLPPGEHLWLVRMRAGNYRWDSLRLAAQTLASSSIRPVSVSVLNDQEFSFDVQAGKVNYPGHLLVDVTESGIHGGVAVRNRNHSAMAIRKLLRSHADLIAAHDLRYAGRSGDEFLDYYSRERARAKSPDRAAATHGEGKAR